ncbi:unnamed protein product [Timema podura]|uniref:MADF domain-containing protein n=1 Tax=Timema podura TaxID=61482 RepID=A0ABN7NVZ0_TIMPD|nr:unnamed protein product [Timema podura]
MMETERFNTELFIDLIQNRPAIWDMECPEYKNRVLKKSSWEELVEIFIEDGDTPEKKKMLGSTLQKKWKSLRDNFAREWKNQKNIPSDSGATR